MDYSCIDMEDIFHYYEGSSSIIGWLLWFYHVSSFFLWGLLCELIYGIFFLDARVIFSSFSDNILNRDYRINNEADAMQFKDPSKGSIDY